MQRIYKYIYFLVVIIRFISLVFFLMNPMLAWLVTYILDLFDYSFALRGGLTYRSYQYIDKTLDFLSRVYFVIAAYYFGWPHLMLFVALFVLRLIGDLFYLKTHSEKYMFIFPNIIEFVFPLYILFLPTPTVTQLVGIMLFSLILKLANEYLLHINKWVDPFSLSYIKKHPEHKRKLV